MRAGFFGPFIDDAYVGDVGCFERCWREGGMDSGKLDFDGAKVLESLIGDHEVIVLWSKQESVIQ